jgi:hypothetical protein
MSAPFHPAFVLCTGRKAIFPDCAVLPFRRSIDYRIYSS